jgi:hypothetical protein
MTIHELRYFRFLIQTIKDLYVEKSAMSTILDGHNAAQTSLDWRSKSESMMKDSVFRSAVEANFEPFFGKLERARSSEQALTALAQTSGAQITICSSEKTAIGPEQ